MRRCPTARFRARRTLLVAALVTVALSAPWSGRAVAGPTPQVAASFFPLAAAVRTVGGVGVQVRDLTPPGVEPHDLDLGSDQVDALLDADLGVVLGGSFQPGIDRVAEQRDGPTLVALDLLGRRAARRAAHDPHVWLDPMRYRDIVVEIGDRLARLDPDHAGGYTRRAAAFADALGALDDAYRTGLARCERHLVLAGHEAFGWLTARYGLRQVGVTRGSPDAEPDPARLADLADLARREGATTVFTEPLASPRVARTLAREAGGLDTAVLDPLEGLQGRGGAHGDGGDYLRVMKRNLAALRTALGCS